jgi:sigma-B regulation protein RsbU (phosphoserine phosphatase)
MLGHSIKRRLVLPNDVQEVPKLAGFIDEFCETCGIDMSTTMSLNLAIEEAVVNVMDYAYPNGGKGDVYIEAECDDDMMTFIIRDNGIPFDPTKASEVDTTLSAEERPIGGLGIHLVRTIMDTEEYSYTDGQNVLTLKKKLNK